MILWIPCIYGGFENFINIIFHDWGNIWKLSCNIAIGEVNAAIFAYIAEAGAWECSGFAYFIGHVFWNVANVVSVRSKHLDGIRVVWVGWFWLQGAVKFAKVVVYIVAVGHSSNIKFNDV